MKSLKQRFSVYYNSSHKRTGTLWSERFKSLLEKGKLALATLVRCRARYFTDGFVLGSSAFVSSILGKDTRKPPRELLIEKETGTKGLAVGKRFRGVVVS